jgi:beta-glucosidase
MSYSNSIVNGSLYDTALILNQGYAKEGKDRNTTVLDYKQLDKFVQGAFKDKKNIIFSAALPGGSILPIDKEVNDAILVNFYLGERMSDAILDVIEGKVNPSGKLPATLPNIANETKWS